MQITWRRLAKSFPRPPVNEIGGDCVFGVVSLFSAGPLSSGFSGRRFNMANNLPRPPTKVVLPESVLLIISTKLLQLSMKLYYFLTRKEMSRMTTIFRMRLFSLSFAQ